jgi:cell shape-determining protein MreD
MKRFRTYATWSVAVIAILLSPIFLIFAIIAVVGIGLDIFDLAGERLMLALSIPVAFLLLRRIPARRWVETFLRSRLHLGHSTQMGEASKSIS